jgi:hypothetical protein
MYEPLMRNPSRSAVFAARGNRNETEQIVRNSLLEAGLLHIRCVIEFLGQKT